MKRSIAYRYSQKYDPVITTELLHTHTSVNKTTCRLGLVADEVLDIIKLHDTQRFLVVNVYVRDGWTSSATGSVVTDRIFCWRPCTTLWYRSRTSIWQIKYGCRGENKLISIHTYYSNAVRIIHDKIKNILITYRVVEFKQILSVCNI